MRGYTHLIISFICFVSINAQQGGESLECFCLPPNQKCDATKVVPRNAVRIDEIVDTRILNQNPKAFCNQFHPIPCCFDVIGKPGGNNNGGGRTSRLGKCGSKSLIKKGSKPGDADFGEFPWMVLLVDGKNAFVATGALISNQYVITAAHKISRKRDLLVRLGDYDISKELDNRKYPVQTIKVDQVITHPQYNSENLHYDMAVLKLYQPAHYAKNIFPVCLPEKGQRFLGQRCYVSGWGKQGIDGDYQPIMKKVDLPIVESLKCQSTLRTTELSSYFILHKSFMCAGGELRKDACEGDGGAPLVCDENGKGVVVGLVAWGRSCGTHAPGLYVNVEYFSDFLRPYV